jgi:hypothetical protein
MSQRLLHRIDANGKSYEIKEVHRKYPDSDDQQFIKLKDIRGYDALIRNEQFYFLCNEISEAEFVDLPNEPVNEPVSEPVNEPINKNNESN